MPGRTWTMTDRMHFVVAAEAREDTMAALCRQFGISRKTGYKWLARVRAGGPAALADRPRVPRHTPHALSEEVRAVLLALRARYPSWGPKKLRARLHMDAPQLPVPAVSTVGDLLRAAGLSVPRHTRRRVPPRDTPLAHAVRPNLVWCADFKGDFRLGNGVRCYPLTVSDACSRYLLRCQALAQTAVEQVQPLFEATFREWGLPEGIRTDNGPPFASTGLAGLTRLSVWWLKLGIRHERIDPGKPQQNGRHERMHGTLKAEACQPPASSLRAQQQRFDRFRRIFNDERPHEALGQQPPATVHTPSPRPFPERLPELAYPQADVVRWVRRNGTIRWRGVELYITQALSGEPVGLTQVGDHRWELCFGPLVLGHFVESSSRLAFTR